jgi:alkylhydroperoxidase family enzyme
MARVPSRRRADADGDDAAIFDRLETERKMPTPNVFLALAHAPTQLDGLLTYAKSLRQAHELGPKLRELVILAIASARDGDGDYIALHHEQDALNAGYSPEQVASIRRQEADAELFSDVERAVLAIGRAIGANKDVTQEEWEAAARHLSNRQLVQLAMTAAWYVGGAILTRLLGLDLEDEYTQPTIPEPRGVST